MKLSPEKLCKAMKCQFQGTSEKGCQAFPDCLALVHAEAVQEALLSKLQNTKLSDLMEKIAGMLYIDSVPIVPMNDGVLDATRRYCQVRADQILSMVTPLIAVQIEAAEKAGMEKVVEWIELHAFDRNTLGTFHLMEAEWQSFLKENGLLEE